LPTILKPEGSSFVNLFGVNIVGLSLATHEFEFELGASFFTQYNSTTISEGKLRAQVSLNKHETFIEAIFGISGTVRLTCDRSLDEFDFPMAIHQKLVYKYGDEDREVSEEVMVIHRDTATLDLGQPMYEYIALAVPMKKLHPRFQDEDTDEEGTLVYSSEKETNSDAPTDPRWDMLKKLK
jgi:uncharacterized protein